MNPWQLMFLQSKVNDNPYYGDNLATQNWAWPRGTWLQRRLSHLRRKQWQSDPVWAPRAAGPAADLRRPRTMPGRPAAGNEMRSEEVSNESYTCAHASSGTEHFS